MIFSYPWRRFLIDSFGYLVFLLSTYIIFGTDLNLRFFLFPVTAIAFFVTLANRYKAAFEEGFESAELVLSDVVEFIKDEDEE